MVKNFQNFWYENERFKSWFKYSSKKDASFLFKFLSLTLNLDSIPAKHTKSKNPRTMR